MTAPRPHVPGTCKDCGQDIRWWPIAGKPNAWCAVDPSSDSDKGHIQRVSVIADERVRAGARFLSKDQVVEATANGELLFTAHRDTCPARRTRNPMPAHVRENLPRRRERNRHR